MMTLICLLPIRMSRRLLFLALLFLNFFSQAQSGQNLNYYIKTAQANSPLLSDYNNQVLSNRIDSMKLNAFYGMIISGEGSAAYSPTIKGWGYDNALTNGQNVFAGVRLSKEFVSRNNLNARQENIKAIAGQILAQKNSSSQTLNKQITDQYITTYNNQQQVDLSREIVYLLRQEDTILKKLTQAAIFKQTDYLSFKVTLQQNELSFEQQMANWKSNFALLNYLAGIADTSFRPLQAPVFDAQISTDFEKSIYTQSFKADSLKLVSDSKIIGYNYKPRISGFLNGGYQSALALNLYKNFGIGAGLSVTLPLYDGHQKQMLIQQNEIALQTRQKYLAHTHTLYDQEILHLKNQINQYEKMIQLAIEQIVYAETLVEANAKQLPTGDVRIVDYILSINNLLTLKGNRIQYDYALFNLKNQLQYLILQ